MSMNCPKCGKRAMCINTRPSSDESTRRRYKCPKCPARWSTIEMVVRVDGRKPRSAGNKFGSLKTQIDERFLELAQQALRDDMKVLLGLKE